MTLTKFFKGMHPFNITQIFHSKHPALDIVSWSKTNGYGTPLCAPENVRIDRITGDTFTPKSHQNLERGYGIHMTGLETGYTYLYWHILPIVPVWGGDIVPRGQIVAYMGNAGYVTSGDKEVPLEKRTKEPYAGTHLHIEVFDGKKRIDPLPLINWNWEPTYSTTDFMKALIVVLQKQIKLRSEL